MDSPPPPSKTDADRSGHENGPWTGIEVHASLNADALFYHAARLALERAKEGTEPVEAARREISDLEAKEEAVLAQFGGDILKAVDDHEPICIALQHQWEVLEEAYKPWLRECAIIHLLCAAALESHINIRAKTKLSRKNTDLFSKLSLEGKWSFFPLLMKRDGFDVGAEPYQSFVRLVAMRNKLTHYRPQREQLQASQRIPSFIGELGLGISAASSSISTVRNMLQTLAQMLNEDAPTWIDEAPFSYFAFDYQLVREPPPVRPSSVSDYGHSVDMTVLEKAVAHVVQMLPEKMHHSVKLVTLSRREYAPVRGSMAPLLTGGTKHCHAVDVIECHEDDENAVGVQSTYYSQDDIASWTRELWTAWMENDE